MNNKDKRKLRKQIMPVLIAAAMSMGAMATGSLAETEDGFAIEDSGAAGIIEAAPEAAVEAAPEPVVDAAPAPVVESAPEVVAEQAPVESAPAESSVVESGVAEVGLAESASAGESAEPSANAGEDVSLGAEAHSEGYEEMLDLDVEETAELETIGLFAYSTKLPITYVKKDKYGKWVPESFTFAQDDVDASKFLGKSEEGIVADENEEIHFIIDEDAAQNEWLNREDGTDKNKKKKRKYEEFDPEKDELELVTSVGLTLFFSEEDGVYTFKMPTGGVWLRMIKNGKEIQDGISLDADVTESEVETEVTTEVVTEGETELVTEGTSEAMTEAVTEISTEAKTEVESEVDAGALIEANTELATDKTETSAETETEPISKNADEQGAEEATEEETEALEDLLEEETEEESEQVSEQDKNQVEDHDEINKEDLTYGTSDEKVATIDKEGKIHAVAPGTCTIYIYNKGELTSQVEITIG